VKDCPDLAAMSGAQRAEFWSQIDPRELRRLGDRLLAESLPREDPGPPREELSRLAVEHRQSAGWSRAQAAGLLGVTESLLEAWETDRVKAPESLAMIMGRLAAMQVRAE
jgi:hypothetical protein